MARKYQRRRDRFRVNLTKESGCRPPPPVRVAHSDLGTLPASLRDAGEIDLLARDISDNLRRVTEGFDIIAKR
jgi:hypothetical protein